MKRQFVVIWGLVGELFLFSESIYGTNSEYDELFYVRPQTITATSSIVDHGYNDPIENQITVQIPSDGIVKSGKMKEDLRYIALTCTGRAGFRGKIDTMGLDIQASEDFPSLFKVDGFGKIVFAEPQPMCTITAPKGRNVWVRIGLQSVKGKYDNIRKYLCLGVRKRGMIDHYESVLFMPSEGDGEHNCSYTYVGVSDKDNDDIELVPLISRYDLSESAYSPVIVGAEVANNNSTLVPEILNKDFDFGSVYKIDVKVEEGAWIEEPCTLTKVANQSWYNYGSLGVGSIRDSNGHLLDNQLVIINSLKNMAYSANGMVWTERDIPSLKNLNGTVYVSTYGNGRWCVAGNGGALYSTDGMEWKAINNPECLENNVMALAFGASMFVAVNKNNSKNIFYRSVNAVDWEPVPGDEFPSNQDIQILCYGGGKWICGTKFGTIYEYDVKNIRWNELIPSEGAGLKSSGSDCWSGACYAYGHFYVIKNDGVVARSVDGKDWEKVVALKDGEFDSWYNITFYNDKLYMFNCKGDRYCSAIFSPNGELALED